MVTRARDTSLNGFADNRPNVFQFGTPGQDAEQQIRQSFNEAIIEYDEKLATKLDGYDPSIRQQPNFATSREHAVLLGITWNGGTGLVGKNLMAALSAGNRAEAWYEIRYGSNKLGRLFIDNSTPGAVWT